MRDQREFAEAVRDLARATGFTRVEMRVEWGNNEPVEMVWQPARDELFEVTEAPRRKEPRP